MLTSAVPPGQLAQFICLSVHLQQRLGKELGQRGMRNKPEEKRRAARLKQAVEVAAKARPVLPKTLRLMQQITQHSAKFIRWIAGSYKNCSNNSAAENDWNRTLHPLFEKGITLFCHFAFLQFGRPKRHFDFETSNVKGSFSILKPWGKIFCPSAYF